MARKVILDVDPGIDDAVALCLALFNPRLEVVAVTAVGGNVGAEQATKNVQALLDQLDPPRLPRVGMAVEPDDGLPADARHLFGPDGLGGANFQCADLAHRHTSERVIIDAVRAAPGEVSIVALGPLTNVARAFLRDPELPSLVHELVMMGGTIGGPGNVTPAAEFNIFCDPASARAVFRSLVTKTLVPLDVTSQVVMNLDFLEDLPLEVTRVGRLTRKIVPYLFRSYRQHLAEEGIHLHDAIALLCTTSRELFDMKLLAGDVEVGGELTRGATVFDRRRLPQSRPNMEVAMSVDVAAARDSIIRGLADAAGNEE
jgi:inosine-uridine nucleoside N-ribohydrolase